MVYEQWLNGEQEVEEAEFFSRQFVKAKGKGSLYPTKRLDNDL